MYKCSCIQIASVVHKIIVKVNFRMTFVRGQKKLFPVYTSNQCAAVRATIFLICTKLY